jgi:hypothetical protein
MTAFSFLKLELANLSMGASVVSDILGSITSDNTHTIFTITLYDLEVMQTFCQQDSLWNFATKPRLYPEDPMSTVITK